MSNLKQELKDLETEFKIQEREMLIDGVLDEIDKALLQKYRAKINQLRSKVDQQEGIPSNAHAEALDVIERLKKVQKRIANLHFKIKKALAKANEENPPGEPCPTPIHIMAEKMQVKIYPNPTENLINIEQNGNESLQIQLLDQLGRSISVHNSSQLITQLNFESLASGVYYLKIRKGKMVATHKVVKR